MGKRFDQKAACARRRIKDDFAEMGIYDGDNELNNGTRRVELAGIACGIAHFAKHGFVERAQSVDFVLRSEVDFVDLVDDIAEEIAVGHAIKRALKNLGDHVAAVTVSTAKGPQIGKEAV